MTSPNNVTGIMLPPGGGERIVGGGVNATIKARTGDAFASTFEVCVPPGYDVGAHLHPGEELFYVVRGQLDVLAFEPIDRSVSDWHEWISEDGRRYLRGGPGSFLYVPAGIPHAFANSTQEETLMFFQSTIAEGHENYFKELAELLTNSNGRPDQSEIEKLRRKYHIEQLTDLSPGH